MAHVAVDVHASELLSSEAAQLLLKLLLALLKVELGSHELGSQVRVDVLGVVVVKLDGRRSKHLLGKRVDLATSGNAEGRSHIYLAARMRYLCWIIIIIRL